MLGPSREVDEQLAHRVKNSGVTHMSTSSAITETPLASTLSLEVVAGDHLIGFVKRLI